MVLAAASKLWRSDNLQRRRRAHRGGAEGGMSTGASFARGQSKQDYATPPDFMHAVIDRFGLLSFDLAASPHNTKNPNYFSIADDSLKQKWHEIRGLLWLNPPFDNIAPWAKKCREEMAMGAKILFLTPASVGSEWFHHHVHRHALVLGLRGRIAFDPDNPKWGYPKDCILSCFGWTPDFDTWRWRDQTPTELA